MAKIIVPTEQSQTFNDNPHMYQSPRELDIRITDTTYRYGRYTMFSVFGWTKDHADRIECGGPKVQGPYASMSAKGAMLTAHKQAPRPVLEISLQDTLEIAGVEYSIRMDRYGYVKLTPVA